jgi:hypothetical protein
MEESETIKHHLTGAIQLRSLDGENWPGKILELINKMSNNPRMNKYRD